LRTFALELKEQLARTLAAFVVSILVGLHKVDAERGEPPLRQIIEVLQQVMCTHDAERLAVAVLEIYGHRYREQ
jgi:Na+/H+-dicarboxylate symporter